MKKINAESKLQLNKFLIGQLNRDNMSRIKGGFEGDDSEDFEDDSSEDDGGSEVAGIGKKKRKTRAICGTSRSARICVSLSPCNGCNI
jgi:hypothetical protein